MPHLLLGNTSPIETYKALTEDGEEGGIEEVVKVPRKDLGNTITRFNIPDNTKLSEALLVVVDAFDNHHSDEPPAWVESDSEALALIISDHYGCPIGQPNSGGEK